VPRYETRSSFVRHARAQRRAFATGTGTCTATTREREPLCSRLRLRRHRMRTTSRDDRGCRESRNTDVRDRRDLRFESHRALIGESCMRCIAFSSERAAQRVLVRSDRDASPVHSRRRARSVHTRSDTCRSSSRLIGESCMSCGALSSERTAQGAFVRSDRDASPVHSRRRARTAHPRSNTCRISLRFDRGIMHELRRAQFGTHITTRPRSQ
jgi:hypothetical protein